MISSKYEFNIYKYNNHSTYYFLYYFIEIRVLIINLVLSAIYSMPNYGVLMVEIS